MTSNPSNSSLPFRFLSSFFEKLVFWTSLLKLKQNYSYITCFNEHLSVCVCIACSLILSSPLCCSITDNQSYQCYWFLFQTMDHEISLHCHQSVTLIIPCPGHYISPPFIVYGLWSFLHLLHLTNYCQIFLESFIGFLLSKQWFLKYGLWNLRIWGSPWSARLKLCSYKSCL